MAVITPRGFGAQRGPSVRPAPPPPDRITAAQQAQIDLSREQMAAQRDAQREALMVQGVFRALGLIQQGVTAGIQLSQDPPEVRAEEARADRLQENLAAMREAEASARIEAQAPGGGNAPIPTATEGFGGGGLLHRIHTTAKTPLAGEPTPAAPAPATGQPRETINMSQGDWNQLVAGWPKFVRMLENPDAMKKAVNDLNKSGFSGSDFKGGMKQLAFLIQNQAELQQKGVLNIRPGEPTGYWQALMGTSEGPEGWRAGYRAASAAGEGEAGVFPLIEQVQKIREASPANAPTVVAKVLENPQALEMAIGEASRSTGNDPRVFDFSAAQEAFRRGDYSEVVRLVTPVLLAPRGTYRGEIKGMDAAQSRFGRQDPARAQASGDREIFYPPPGSYSIQEVRDAWAALNEAGDPRAARLLDDRLVLNAADVESVPGVLKAGGESALLGKIKEYVRSGKPEFLGGGREQAEDLVRAAKMAQDMSLAERRVETQERAVELRGLRSVKDAKSEAFNITKGAKTSAEQQAAIDELMATPWVQHLAHGFPGSERPGMGEEKVRKLVTRYVKSGQSNQALIKEYDKKHSLHKGDLGAKERSERAGRTEARAERGEERSKTMNKATLQGRLANAREARRKLGDKVTGSSLKSQWESGAKAAAKAARKKKYPGRKLAAFYESQAQKKNDAIIAADNVIAELEKLLNSLEE